MSRRFTLLAAAVAFCGLTAVAQAQGSGGTEGGSPVTTSSTGAAGASGTTMRRARPMRAQRPMMHSNRAAMRGNAGRGAMARGARPASDANAAYMGGGAVYERGADGSLRPAN